MSGAPGFIRRLARIERTMLGVEDHGIFTSMLYVTYGGQARQGVGGFAIKTVAGPFIQRTLEACGVESWEQLVGRTIHVLLDEKTRLAVGIEPLPTELGKPFLFSELTTP